VKKLWLPVMLVALSVVLYRALVGLHCAGESETAKSVPGDFYACLDQSHFYIAEFVIAIAVSVFAGIGLGKSVNQ